MNQVFCPSLALPFGEGTVKGKIRIGGLVENTLITVTHNHNSTQVEQETILFYKCLSAAFAILPLRQRSSIML